MPGVLLDSHALYWLASGESELSPEALIAIGESQDQDALFVSPITAWELAVATRKNRVADRPHLGELSPLAWFRDAIRLTSSRIIPIKQRISLEAAKVVSDTGHKDPGDCFLIATARVRKLPIVTRDAVMLKLAAEHPDYLTVIAC